VEIEIEVWIVYPDRPVDLEGNRTHLLSEPGHEVDAVRDEFPGVVEPELPVVTSRRIEDGEAGDVHMHVRLFQVEERTVKRAQAVHRDSSPRR
jgi:hypothetical protein